MATTIEMTNIKEEPKLRLFSEIKPLEVFHYYPVIEGETPEYFMATDEGAITLNGYRQGEWLHKSRYNEVDRCWRVVEARILIDNKD